MTWRLLVLDFQKLDQKISWKQPHQPTNVFFFFFLRFMSRNPKVIHTSAPKMLNSKWLQAVLIPLSGRSSKNGSGSEATPWKPTACEGRGAGSCVPTARAGWFWPSFCFCPTAGLLEDVGSISCLWPIVLHTAVLQVLSLISTIHVWVHGTVSGCHGVVFCFKSQNWLLIPLLILSESSFSVFPPESVEPCQTIFLFFLANHSVKEFTRYWPRGPTMILSLRFESPAINRFRLINGMINWPKLANNTTWWYFNFCWTLFGIEWNGWI